jgi:hypothetical protein
LLNRIIEYLIAKSIPYVYHSVIMKSTGNETSAMLGQYAKQLIKNPALDTAFKRIEAKIMKDWRGTSGKDKDKREHEYYKILVLDEIRASLIGMVANMKLEEEIARQKKESGE